MVSPKKLRLDFGTNAWTAGTKGRVVAAVVMAPKTMEQLEEMRESIEGNYVLIERPTFRGRRRTPPPRAAQGEDKKADDDKEKKPEPVRLTREQRQELSDAIKACKPAGLISSTSGELILTGGSYKVETVRRHQKAS
jgi:hypothetical protein